MITGQKVVCIDDQFGEWARFYEQMPKKDSVYVIRGVFVGIGPDRLPGEVGVYLVGITNPRSSTKPFAERGFSSNRFRPLDEVQKENEQQLVCVSGSQIHGNNP